MSDEEVSRGSRKIDLASALAFTAVAAAGVGLTLNSSAHDLHDPVHGLQQLDMFYLSEPAPQADALDLTTGAPTLVVICEDCERPDVDAAVVMTADPEVARDYGLLTEDGRVGPGYAVIDAAMTLRYRTFDPDPAAHVEEIAILLDNAR